MQRKITIEYSWQCSKLKKGIPDCLVEALENSATEHIFSEIDNGYVEGELFDWIKMQVPKHKTPVGGWECHGYWTSKREEL